MEDTHGESQAAAPEVTPGLNPYYNGRYSWSAIVFDECHHLSES